MFRLLATASVPALLAAILSTNPIGVRQNARAVPGGVIAYHTRAALGADLMRADRSVRELFFLAGGRITVYPPEVFVPHAGSAVLGVQRIIKSPAAVAALSHILRQSRHPVMRFVAAQALARLGQDEGAAVRALIDTAASGGVWPSVRKQAISDLGQLGPDAAAAVPTLIAVLSDPDAGDLHMATVRTLGEIGPKAAPAIPVLRRFTIDRRNPRLKDFAHATADRLARTAE